MKNGLVCCAAPQLNLTRNKKPIEMDRSVREEHQNQIVRRVTNTHLNLIRVTNFNLDSIERRVRMNLAFSGDG